MASLDTLCFKPFNLKNKIMKIEHTKIFHGPSKILENISWPINICLKFSWPPQKPSAPPLLHTYSKVPSTTSLEENEFFSSFQFFVIDCS